MKRHAAALIASLGAGLLSGCDLAPVYDPPHFILPDSYQGSGPFAVAHPDEALSPRGDWWTLFGDEQLNQLEDQLGRANPTLQAAADAYAQARSLAAEAQSALSPQVSASAGVSENKESVNRLFRSPNSTAPIREASNQFGVAASWEPDFWHALRNSAHAQKRLAQASAADLATARLSLQAELANDYVAVRGLDAQLEVLRQSIASYQAAVEVARLRTQREDRFRPRSGAGVEPTRFCASSRDRDPAATRSDAACRGRAGRCDAEHLLDRADQRVPVDSTAASCGRAFGAAAAPTRHRERRTSDGGCERLDRRVARRVLSQCDIQLDGRLPG